MTDRKLMQQALDALNNSVDLVREDAYNAEKLYGNYPTRQGKVGGLKVLADDHEKAITALRDRLAQPEQGPVAWQGVHDHTDLYYRKPPQTDVRPLYTNPRRQWVGLTDKELEAMAEKYVTNCYFDTLKYARAIEAKLKDQK